MIYYLLSLDLNLFNVKVILKDANIYLTLYFGKIYQINKGLY